jgi:hypothetical protein
VNIQLERSAKTYFQNSSFGGFVDSLHATIILLLTPFVWFVSPVYREAMYSLRRLSGLAARAGLPAPRSGDGSLVLAAGRHGKLAGFRSVRSSVLPAAALQLRGFHTSHLVLQQQEPPQQGRSWVSPDAVPKGESLKKFCRDLTAAAKSGKLDPVIGMIVIRPSAEATWSWATDGVCVQAAMKKSSAPFKS